MFVLILSIRVLAVTQDLTIITFSQRVFWKRRWNPVSQSLSVITGSGGHYYLFPLPWLFFSERVIFIIFSLLSLIYIFFSPIRFSIHFYFIYILLAHSAVEIISWVCLHNPHLWYLFLSLHLSSHGLLLHWDKFQNKTTAFKFLSVCMSKGTMEVK